MKKTIVKPPYLSLMLLVFLNDERVMESEVRKNVVCKSTLVH